MKKTLERWKKRQELKIKCVEYLGGKCIHCGYNKCIGALDFHHRDERTKKFKVSTGIMHLYAWEKLRLELDNCDLTCANCHREIHWHTFNDINITLTEELE